MKYSALLATLLGSYSVFGMELDTAWQKQPVKPLPSLAQLCGINVVNTLLTEVKQNNPAMDDKDCKTNLIAALSEICKQTEQGIVAPSHNQGLLWVQDDYPIHTLPLEQQLYLLGIAKVLYRFKKEGMLTILKNKCFFSLLNNQKELQDVFITACEKNYPRYIKHMSEKLMHLHNMSPDDKTWTLQAGFSEALANDHEQVIATLLELPHFKSFNFDWVDADSGETYFMEALVKPTTYNVARLLLKKRKNNEISFDINLQDPRGLTPLMWAVHCTVDLDLVRSLIKEHGADINLANNLGHTPLMQAVVLLPSLEMIENREVEEGKELLKTKRARLMETIKLLLDQPTIDLYRINNHGESVLSIVESKDADVLELFINHLNQQ